MTRQDFQLIADVVASVREMYADGQTVHDVYANAFAEALATTNDRFDSARFLKACRVEA